MTTLPEIADELEKRFWENAESGARELGAHAESVFPGVKFTGTRRPKWEDDRSVQCVIELPASMAGREAADVWDALVDWQCQHPDYQARFVAVSVRLAFR